MPTAVTADRVVVQLDAEAGNFVNTIRSSRAAFTREMQSMTSAAQLMERRVAAAGDNMSRSIARAIAAVGVMAAVRDVRELADTWTQASNKLAAAGVPVERLGAATQELANIARETRSDFASTVDINARLIRSTQDINATYAQRLRVTELINKATKAGGATTQEQISTITQLGQALASGGLQGDELRSIRENAPLVARAIANEFGTTIGGLKAMGKEGKLSSDRVFKAILDSGALIDDQFAKTKATVQDSFTAMRTEAGRFQHSLDASSGASRGISDFISGVADDFDQLAQAVIIASAVVGGALVGRMSRGLQETAVTHATFVRSLIDGTSAFQLEANAIRANALQVQIKAEADAEGAQVARAAAQQRITALRQEAAQYETNIALAAEQRAAAAKQLPVTRANQSAGLGFSGGRVADVEAQRNQATRALIASRRALTAVTAELAVAEVGLTAADGAYLVAQQNVRAAERAMQAAIAETSIIAKVASVAMKGLGTAMSFFGGPIGIAIMAVAAALAYFATEGAKAARAGEDASAILSELRTSAELNNETLAELNTQSIEAANATGELASQSGAAATALNGEAMAAANAAEAVKYLTGMERLRMLQKLRETRDNLQIAFTGGTGLKNGIVDAFTTDAAERAENARRRVIKSQGITPGAAGLPGSDEQFRQAYRAAQGPNATAESKAAVQAYREAVTGVNGLAQNIRDVNATIGVVEKNVDAPTLQRPKTPTGNLRTPPSTGGKDRAGSTKGTSGKTPEELQEQREELLLQERIEEARAAGAEKIAEFLGDELDTRRQIRTLMQDGLGMTREEATAEVDAHMQRMRRARETKDAADEAADAEKEHKKAKEEWARDEEKFNDQAYRQSQAELQVKLELARLADDSARVKELERILALNERIRQYEEMGLDKQTATSKAIDDEISINDATDRANDKFREGFKGAMRAALDDDLGSYLENWFHDWVGKGMDSAVDVLFDALKGIDWGGLFGGKGGSSSGGGGFMDVVGSAMQSLFGGGKAGGGIMQAGKWYMTGENGPEPVYAGTTARAFPNSAFRAAQGAGGGGNLNLQVINQTGVAAKATTERKSNGDTTLTLQPMFEQGLEGAGRSGKLQDAAKLSPKPTRRG